MGCAYTRGALGLDENRPRALRFFCAAARGGHVDAACCAGVHVIPERIVRQFGSDCIPVVKLSELGAESPTLSDLYCNACTM